MVNNAATGRRRAASRWIGAAALVALAAPVTAVAAGQAGAASPQWAVQASEVPPPTPEAVACGSATDCAAVGGSTAVSSADGGATWQSASLPAGVTGLDAVSCPSADDCVAVGEVASGSLGAAGEIVTSSDGGATWSSAAVPSGTPGLTGVSCGSAEDCVAVGPSEAGLDTLEGFDASRSATGAGEAGSARSPAARVAALADHVPAGRLRFDLAVDAAHLSGAARTTRAHDSDVGGPNVLVSNDGGQTWAAASGSSVVLADVDAVTCPSATTCVAVGGVSAAVSDDGGATWTVGGAMPGTATAPTMLSVTCTSATACIAVGYAEDVGGSISTQTVLAVTADAGTTWTAGAAPAVAADEQVVPDAVACSSASDCVAVGESFAVTSTTVDGVPVIAFGEQAPLSLTSTDGGTNWTDTSSAVPHGASVLDGVACVPSTAGTCLAVGAAGLLGGLASSELGGVSAVLLTTTTAGTTWQSDQTLPSGVAAVDGVSCPTSSACVAVGVGSDDGAFAAGTTDGGATWTTQTVPAALGMLFAVSCSSATDCVAVGGEGLDGPATAATTTDGGTTWTASTLPAGAGTLSAVACPTTTTCVAVGTALSGGGEILVSSDGGTSWSTASQPAATTELLTVACPTATRCLVGGTAAPPQQILPVADDSSPTPFTAGGVLWVSTDAGQTWAQTAVPVDAQLVDGVSCGSASDCVAVGTASNDAYGELEGSDGFVLTSTTGGASWTPRPLPPGTLGLDAVSCPSASDCVAVGQAAGTDEGANLEAVLLGEEAGQGAVLTSDDAGDSWSADTIPSSLASADAVACGSTAMCEVGGSDGQGGGTIVGTGNAEPPPSASAALTVPLATVEAPSYWQVAADGGVFAFGQAPYEGSMGSVRLAKPVVGMAYDPSSGGYWEVASDGGIFAFGGANFYGSMGGRPLSAPIVAMAATPDGGGYWLVAADGGVFAFGDAGYYGSVPALPAAERGTTPVDDLVPTPDGGGYWEVDWSGAVFAFGDAGFFGSMGGQHLSGPVVGMATTPDGLGYWLVGSDGGIFAYGDAPYEGSTGALHLAQPVVGIAATDDGAGYWLVARDGGIFAFGDAGFAGSMGGKPLTAPVVGMVGL